MQFRVDEFFFFQTFNLFKVFLFCFRASTPHSDTESSDEDDDVSDHDLTPCNPSPNMSQLLGKIYHEDFT